MQIHQRGWADPLPSWAGDDWGCTISFINTWTEQKWETGAELGAMGGIFLTNEVLAAAGYAGQRDEHCRAPRREKPLGMELEDVGTQQTERYFCKYWCSIYKSVGFAASAAPAQTCS